MKYIKHFTEIINEKRVPRDERIQLYKDENVIVIVPLTHDALIKYANKCQWCINSDRSEWEYYYKGSHCVIIQRRPKTNKIGMTGIETSDEIFLMAKFDNGDSTFEDVCQMLGYDFSDENEMVNYYMTISTDISNFSTNIVYYSPIDSMYDMSDNHLTDFHFKLEDIPNITQDIINTINSYFTKKVN